MYLSYYKTGSKTRGYAVKSAEVCESAEICEVSAIQLESIFYKILVIENNV